MENGELSGTGAGCQLSGLTGCEVAFLACHFPVFVQKGGFDKQMIGLSGEFYDFFSMVANDINRLTGETARNIHLAKMLFAEDVKEITSGLNDMADVAQESLKVFIEYKDGSTPNQNLLEHI